MNEERKAVEESLLRVRDALVAASEEIVHLISLVERDPNDQYAVGFNQDFLKHGAKPSMIAEVEKTRGSKKELLERGRKSGRRPAGPPPPWPKKIA